MSLIEKNDLMYCLTKEDVQYEALEHIGRTLTECEMEDFRKIMDYGIGENMLFMWKALFDAFEDRCRANTVKQE